MVIDTTLSNELQARDKAARLLGKPVEDAIEDEQYANKVEEAIVRSAKFVSSRSNTYGKQINDSAEVSYGKDLLNSPDHVIESISESLGDNEYLKTEEELEIPDKKGLNDYFKTPEKDLEDQIINSLDEKTGVHAKRKVREELDKGPVDADLDRVERMATHAYNNDSRNLFESHIPDLENHINAIEDLSDQEYNLDLGNDFELDENDFKDIDDFSYSF